MELEDSYPVMGLTSLEVEREPSYEGFKFFGLSGDFDPGESESRSLGHTRDEVYNHSRESPLLDFVPLSHLESN